MIGLAFTWRPTLGFTEGYCDEEEIFWVGFVGAVLDKRF